jgi:cation transport ATPase
MLGWRVHRPESNGAMVIETYVIILVRNNPLNIVAIVKYSHAILRKIIPKHLRATGSNTFVIPLATSALYTGHTTHSHDMYEAYGYKHSDCGY